MPGRDNFSAPTKRTIAERAGYVCSFPGCGRLTIGPSDDRASGVTMTGTAAHIVAAASGGQRSDAALTSAQRSSADNGIWMCAIHGKWIDDNPSIATVPTLLSWKADHEAEISAWVAHGHPGIFQSWDRLAALTRDQRETIETRLPNGHEVERDTGNLLEALRERSAFLVIGDSGVGKSALVKVTLDTHFPEARQVWLGPEALRTALSEAEHNAIGLTAPLGDLLETSSAPKNILVVDAVERADAMTMVRLGQLIQRLSKAAADRATRWQLVVVAQQAGFEAHLDPVITAVMGSVVVDPFSTVQVRQALASVPALSQHAYDDAFVALVDNPRMLAWIISAGPSFADDQAGHMAARPQIADRLWSYWTGGDPDLHSFMIALARRDADYERSFAISALSAADRTAWKSGRGRLPLVADPRHRLSFQHDLATDWARYQSLKEIAGDVGRWSGLANQPLWVAALRLFGQFLLREPDQSTQGWDWAFAAARAIDSADAIDILLDALCTDPAADNFLAARAEILFANEGKLLDRLLARFMHIATVPERSEIGALGDLGMTLYAEAEMRSPIWSAWPPLIRFLVKYRASIAPFGSCSVAKICKYWLTKTPSPVAGRAVLGRVGIAELALDTARVEQVRSLAHSYYGSRSDAASDMFEAALAGAEDNLEAVSSFALEMARRRPLAPPVQAEVDRLKAEERKMREESARRSPRRRREALMSMSMFGNHPLPPWPLGASGRLNDAFRTAVVRNDGLVFLMKAAPAIAAEVLLACVIDDKPHAEHRSMTFDDRLGLQWAHEDRPTLFWTSPFFRFLAQSEETALQAILNLVDFCTERWSSDRGQGDGEQIEVTLSDGDRRVLHGDWQVFDWSHTRRTHNSQLYTALDALERWLFMKVKARADIAPLCRTLLEQTRSAAILGVLTDCAKLDPSLLEGPLAPLLSSPLLIFWDEYRLGHRFGNDVFTWHRAGEAARRFGIAWEQEPHRTTALKHVVRDHRRTNADFNAQLTASVAAWPKVEGNRDLRQRALIAEIDPTNFREAVGDGGETVVSFSYPPEIAAEIAALRTTETNQPTLADVLNYLQQLLREDLSAEDAAALYSAFEEHEEIQRFSDRERHVIRVAVAAVLVVRAGAWVEGNPAVFDKLTATLAAGVPDASEFDEALDEQSHVDPGFAWAMVGAIYAKARGAGDSARWDQMLSFGLATGDNATVRTIIGAARLLKTQLGASYYAIIETSVFSAALNGLVPRMEGEPGSAAAMARWRGRLARRPLAVSRHPVTFDLVNLSHRIERIWRHRFERLSGKDIGPVGRRNLHRRYSFGPGTHLLAATFDWSLVEAGWTENEAPPPSAAELAEHRAIIRMLWDLADWRLRGDPYEEPLEEHDGYGMLDDFGLQIQRTIAARIPLGSAAESRILWEPILALGPRGEYTLEHLIDGFFLRLYKDIDANNFIANWTAMVAFIFAPGWSNGGKYWRGREIMRRVLGFNAASQIANNPKVLAQVAKLAPYYETFAHDHIPHDDSALAAFASFAASDAGVAMRIAAIGWIEQAVIKDEGRLKGNAAAALAELAQVLLAHHSQELIADARARQALNIVIGRMVRDQAPYALTLQDRARGLH